MDKIPNRNIMNFQRRARPQVNDDSDDYGTTDSSTESPKEVEKRLAGSGGGSHPEDERTSDSESESDKEDDDEVSDSEEGNAQGSIAQISFGTLAKAQKSLLKDRQKPNSIPRETRIAAAKAQLAAVAPSKAEKPRKLQDDLRRSSKHAPQELSSKRAVTRRREVIAPIIPPSQAARDPRFDDAVKGIFDERAFKNNYSFLNEYREQEIKTLKEEISKCRDETTREQLSKSLLSLESKRKTEEDKEQAQGVVSEHKKKERELIKQGKKPFYLKKAEQKKLLLLQKYSKLNEKQLEKVIEKKRKRKSQKERKSMPFERRAG